MNKGKRKDVKESNKDNVFEKLETFLKYLTVGEK